MGASQEILFAKTLEEVKQLAREQGGNIESSQVKEAFAELNLQDEQLEMVFDYLKKNKIGVDAPVDLDDYLSEEETDYLEEYKKELASLKQYSDGEKEAVTLSAMAGEADAQKELICIYLPQVIELSKLYAGQGVYLEDLIGEGNMALATGVTMLGCLEHAREAEGMLIKMVMDAMEECIAENLEETDRDKKVLDKVNKVAEKAKELAEDLHRKVTVAELAEETGMSVKAIQDVMRISGYAIEDLEG
ncbi:MAG: hypothetical protein IJ409_07025 [Lachnospiraceae bacterium]|nr:hypothetical protein [Lachnospiraceae bacterium]